MLVWDTARLSAVVALAHMLVWRGIVAPWIAAAVVVLASAALATARERGGSGSSLTRLVFAVGLPVAGLTFMGWQLGLGMAEGLTVLALALPVFLAAFGLHLMLVGARKGWRGSAWSFVAMVAPAILLLLLGAQRVLAPRAVAALLVAALVVNALGTQRAGRRAHYTRAGLAAAAAAAGLYTHAFVTMGRVGSVALLDATAIVLATLALSVILYGVVRHGERRAASQ